MKIVIQPSHHGLPFWHNPTQPRQLFDPVPMSEWTAEVENEEETRKQSRLVIKEIPMKDHWLWPILMGIYQMDMPMVLAHVSINLEAGRLHEFKRMWVQFSTMPKETNPNGIPVVVRNKDVLVSGLWGWNNGTYSPWELDGAKDVSREEKMKPEFWRAFFEAKLREAKTEAIRKAEKALAEAQKLKADFDAVI